MSGKDREYGDETPLYQCVECGDHTVVPVEVHTDSVVPLECPSCGHDDLVSVDDLCRVGRTISPHESECQDEWSEIWEKPNLRVRLCEDHYEEFTGPLPLPDNAVGRCEEDDCTHAVFEESGDGKIICNACRNASSVATANERPDRTKEAEQ